MFGNDMADMLFAKVKKEIGDKKVRAALAHADNLPAAQKLKRLLEENLRAEVVFISQVSAVIGNHCGPGTLIISYHEVDN